MEQDDNNSVRDLLAFALDVPLPNGSRQRTIERVLREIGSANFIPIPEPEVAAESAPDSADDNDARTPGTTGHDPSAD